MNQIENGILGAIEQNLFFYICARIREHNDELVNISFESIRKNTGFTASGTNSLVRKLLEMNRSLLGLNFEHVINDGSIIQGGVFSTFITNPKEKILTVRVNKDLLFLLNNLDINFTDWELMEFMHIKSAYSKRLYRLIKEWKKKGETPYISIEDIRTRLGIPTSYENKKFMAKVFYPACEDMKNYFQDFNFNTYRESKKGAPITAICFTFQKQIAYK